uniref:Uncharacterized protein n=1 Tax=Glossina brevipalpis TaxID=37001 RepID=A0A1A9WZK7_9MUSC
MKLRKKFQQLLVEIDRDLKECQLGGRKELNMKNNNSLHCFIWLALYLSTALLVKLFKLFENVLSLSVPINEYARQKQENAEKKEEKKIKPLIVTKAFLNTKHKTWAIIFKTFIA